MCLINIPIIFLIVKNTFNFIKVYLYFIKNSAKYIEIVLILS